MKKTINFCGNCPFLDSRVDNENNMKCTCKLLLFINDKVLDIDNDILSDMEILDDCPLKNEKLEFNFNPFSKNRLDEIKIVENEIEKLETELNSKYKENQNIEDINDDDIEQLNMLFEKLNKLLENEDMNFQTEFNKNIQKIQDEIFKLGESGNKLNNILNNMNDKI